MKASASRSFPWIHSAAFDLLFIVGPAFITSIIALVFRNRFENSTAVPTIGWILLILCVDVAHVYATLFKTYFAPTIDERERSLNWAVPLFTWLGGVILYSLSALAFWRVLAYLAVFHFVRQQYGFFMIYSRDHKNTRFQWLDRALIYATTVYPLIYWHTHLPRNFHWFIEGDFISLSLPYVNRIAGTVYLILAISYLFREIYLFKTKHKFNLPKNLLLFGTALSWYVGIVVINGDIAFTLTNVVAHGVPYIALIWIVGNRASAPSKSKTLFRPLLLPLFLGLLIVLAFLEEGLWDGFIWREHTRVFSFFSSLPIVNDRDTLTWLIPLLSLPQAAHYVFDGFIWKLRPGKNAWASQTLSVQR